LARFRRQGDNIALRRAGFPGERRFKIIRVIRIAGILPFVTVYIVKSFGVVFIFIFSFSFRFLFGYGISTGPRNPYRGKRYRFSDPSSGSGRVTGALSGGGFAAIPASGIAGFGPRRSGCRRRF
jgi:hypothetical protein